MKTIKIKGCFNEVMCLNGESIKIIGYGSVSVHGNGHIHVYPSVGQIFISAYDDVVVWAHDNCEVELFNKSKCVLYEGECTLLSKRSKCEAHRGKVFAFTGRLDLDGCQVILEYSSTMLHICSQHEA